MKKSNKILSSVAEINKRRGDEWLIRQIEIHHPSDNKMFAKRLYQELDDIIKSLEETAHLRDNDSEDKLTSDIVLLLRQTGYEASHDKDTRGHVDMRVEKNSFIWIGEAKIHRSYDWLLEGLKQLLTRYSTGKEDGFGLLIYIRNANAKAVMEEWRKRLEKGNECNLKETNDGLEKLTFWSLHQHEGSGLDISTKHIGVSLYYNPKK